MHACTYKIEYGLDFITIEHVVATYEAEWLNFLKAQ